MSKPLKIDTDIPNDAAEDIALTPDSAGDFTPEMFQELLKLRSGGALEVPHFAFYLKRHIELDGDSHGPLAKGMLIALAAEDEDEWLEATLASQRALISRIKLWDGVVAHLKTVH